MLIPASDRHYLDVLTQLHGRTFDRYLEIGSRSGRSLALSRSPSIAIDPYFDLRRDVVGIKTQVHLFQCSSDDFFKHNEALLAQTSIDFCFVDGMHLFEFALRDTANVARFAARKSLILLHDILPGTFAMATRDHQKVASGAPWTGDIWKLIPILSRFMPQQDLVIVPSRPTGLLAIFNVPIDLADRLVEAEQGLFEEWEAVELASYGPEAVYDAATLLSADELLARIAAERIGRIEPERQREWVSH